MLLFGGYARDDGDGDGDGDGEGGGGGSGGGDGDEGDDDSWVPGSSMIKLAQITHMRLDRAMQLAQHYPEELARPDIVFECSEVMVDTFMVSSDKGGVPESQGQVAGVELELRIGVGEEEEEERSTRRLSLQPRHRRIKH